MNNIESINDEILTILGLSDKSKIYNSNIGFIIISSYGDFVYKVYTDIISFDNEVKAYFFISTLDILIPRIEILGLVKEYYVIKLENVRKYYKRKNNIIDLDLKKVANIIGKIHTIKENGKSFILGDIHSSNFYEINYGGSIKLGIFDFSSSKYGEIEEDLSNIYIDLGIREKLFNKFIYYYNNKVDMYKLYNYTIKELNERIKNGMNLSISKRKMYYKFLMKLKLKLGKI